MCPLEVDGWWVKPCVSQPQNHSPCPRTSARSVLTGRRRGNEVGEFLPQNTLNGRRPSLNTRKVLDMWGRGATDFCARCAAESEVQIHSLCATLCGKESSLSVPYLQLWSLIGNWIYYALKSHLEMWEGMTAPASPTQMDPDRRATSNGRARSVPSVSATGGIRAISAPLRFSGRTETPMAGKDAPRPFRRCFAQPRLTSGRSFT